jgi:hypothetical protein
MQALFDTVRWHAREHPARSRGAAAAGAGWPVPDSGAGDDRTEECCVLTRNPSLLFFHLPRSKVFHPDRQAPWGILWWRGVDDARLAELHAVCLRVCAEIGLTEFCAMCHTGGPAARRYWREMLGDTFEYLRWRT